jgi:hypothetical protein
MSDALLQGFRDTSQTPTNTPVASSAGLPDAKKEEIRNALDEAMAQNNKSREELELEETAWSSEDSLAAAQRFFSSAALGWGDEASLWVSAIINANVTYPYYDLKTTSKEQYKKLKKEYDAQQAEFKQRQAGAALAADVAGGLVSPAMALKAPAAVASRLGPTKTAAAGAIGTGAVYGAGEATEGQRLEGAGIGALGGGLGYGAVKAVTAGSGAVANALTKRRVEGDLVDTDGDFVPITLAASSPTGVEGFIHQFYRDVVGPSFGAKGAIRQQQEVILDKAEDAIAAQKKFSNQLDEGIREKTKLVEQQLRDAGSALKEEQKALTSLKRGETADVTLPLKEKLSALNSGKAEEIAAKATSETRKMMDARQLNFRQEAFVNSFPEGAVPRDIERVLSKENIGERISALDELWRVKGYSMINKKKFRFKAGELQNNLEKALVKDPYFVANTVDIPSVMKVFDNAIESTNFFKDPSGRVEGSLVSSLRSRIGTLANATVDPQNRRALYTLQDEIDKIMKSQLTAGQKEAFEKEAGKWKSTVVLREAIEGTQGGTKRGYFEVSDWIKEVGKNNRWDSRYGTGPLNAEARKIESNLKAMEKTIAKRATNLAKTKAALVEKEIKSHKKKLESELTKLVQDTRIKKSRLRRNPELTSEIAAATTRKSQVEAELGFLTKELDQLKDLRTSKNPSWYWTLTSSSLLGSLTGAAVGAATGGFVGIGAGALAAPIAGTVIGARLARPGVQRAIAGQTPEQQAVQRMLQSDMTGETARILGQAGGVTGARTGMLTEQ